ncbi:helix-turn-helix domain-containing protein [Candidatus Hecatella orcuttiae]|uniref:helix-turn-helix domain-containing protein n=1 Tax=Candidatus Hecatella orcuttiae TaxID=1935119 RepID=UPI0028680F38|nr:helix-turn-helix domain-containing protein [Candidatus Hecatella orcuttiae]
MEFEVLKKVYELTQFGLTLLQAKVYVGLLQLGKSSASQIAKTVNMHKAEAYRVLRELEKLELAEASLGRPITFQPVHPRKALTRLLSQLSSKMKSLSAKKRELSLWLSSIPKRSVVEEKEHVRFELISEQAGNKRIASMLKRAKKEFLFVTPVELLGTYISMLDGATLRGLMRRGVKVKGILEVKQFTDRFLNHLMGLVKRYQRVVDLRHSDDLASRLTICDGKELLVGAQVKPGMGERFDLWTNSPSYIAITKRFFDEMWVDSVPMGERVQELKTGEPRELFTVIKNFGAFRDKALEMMNRAEKEMLFISGVRGWRQVAQAGLVEAFTKTLKRGVKAKGIVEVEEENLKDVKKLRKYCELRHLSHLNTRIFVVDGEEMTYGYATEKWTRIWTNSKSFVAAAKEHFQRLWEISSNVDARISELETASLKNPSLAQWMQAASFPV